MSTKHETKLQLRLYPEKDEQHRRALAWLKEHKMDGVSYGDLVAQAICGMIDGKQREDEQEQMRQVVRDELRIGLRNVTAVATAAAPPADAPKPTEGSRRKAQSFMAGMGFG